MWSSSCVVRTMRSKNRSTFIVVILLGFCIMTVLFAYSAFGQDSFDTLQQAHVVFRHGEKTPSSSYENDPYKDYKYWSIGWGELTNKGKQQLYELGKLLRFRYQKFLSEEYSPKDVLVRSSYASRCQMSAMTLLAGLYPPKGDQVWNPDLLWQPIPVNPIPRDLDNMIASKAACPAFSVEKSKSDASMDPAIFDEHKDLFQYLTEHAGQPINNISDVEGLYNTLLIEKDFNLKLPEWTHTVFPDPMRKLALLNLASYTNTPLLKKLQAGPMLGEWLKHLEKRSKTDHDVKKLYLYSGHDLTIVNLLRSLGIKDFILPEFGSALVVELHYIHLVHYVHIYHYSSSNVKEPMGLTIPGCSSPCPLERFVELIKPIVPLNWEQECKIS